MNPDTLPVIVVVLAMFAIFMAVLGGVSVWTWMPQRAQRRSPQSAPASLAAEPAR